MDNANPRVTIGLPVFNGEDYLEEALESVLSQTFEDFELIITDNASTDRTEAICRRFAAADPRVRYYRNQTNLGAARNYNILVDLAQGEFFKWIAHDDLNAPTTLEKCVAMLDAHQEAIMAYPKTILIDEYGRIIEYHEDGFDLRSPRPHRRLHQAFQSSAWCHPVFGLIRKNVLEQSGLIGNFASSDKVLLVELAVLGQCHEVPEYLAYRRLHPHNSTSANTTDEAMAAWFDPAAVRQVVSPRLQRMAAVARAIGRASISPLDKALCYLEFSRFYLSIGRLAGAGRDARQIGRRFSAALRGQNRVGRWTSLAAGVLFFAWAGKILLNRIGKKQGGRAK